MSLRRPAPRQTTSWSIAPRERLERIGIAGLVEAQYGPAAD